VICKYVALFVPDLRAAEDFYGRLFAMELLFREGKEDGEWAALRPEKGWDDVEAAGAELSMAALRRDQFVLALFQGAPTAGTVLEICLGLEPEEIDAVLARLPEDTALVPEPGGEIKFDDPFGFRWTLEAPDVPFLSTVALAGRWLDV
jgi:catechol 2,3-dioxygenase-like lactoylglutathione lyase family enzyme